MRLSPIVQYALVFANNLSALTYCYPARDEWGKEYRNKAEVLAELAEVREQYGNDIKLVVSSGTGVYGRHNIAVRTWKHEVL